MIASIIVLMGTHYVALELSGDTDLSGKVIIMNHDSINNCVDWDTL